MMEEDEITGNFEADEPEVVLVYPDRAGKFKILTDKQKGEYSTKVSSKSGRSDLSIKGSKKRKEEKGGKGGKGGKGEKSLDNSASAPDKDEEKSSQLGVTPIARDIKTWPTLLKKKIIDRFGKDVDAEATSSFLSDWPEGLKQTIYQSCKKVAIRLFIVDDSGSMTANDGKMIDHERTKMIKCTRWKELSESILFMAELSERLQAPSEIRLLNGADPIVVGIGKDGGGNDSLAFVKEVLSDEPAGQTPLCAHINAIVSQIITIKDILLANKQKAAVIICTDGESSDGDVAKALKPLTFLPVLVILRLCTSEQSVVDYWNNIDAQLELDIDVLDDQLGTNSFLVN